MLLLLYFVRARVPARSSRKLKLPDVIIQSFYLASELEIFLKIMASNTLHVEIFEHRA